MWSKIKKNPLEALVGIGGNYIDIYFTIFVTFQELDIFLIKNIKHILGIGDCSDTDFRSKLK